MTDADDRDVDEYGRRHPPVRAGEVDTLLGFLKYQRATLEWKCRGVDADGMRATVGASTMTLGGLLKHLALVEDSWTQRRIHGRGRPAPWDAVDWSADPDWDARHNGHADLLREAVDGATGE